MDHSYKLVFLSSPTLLFYSNDSKIKRYLFNLLFPIFPVYLSLDRLIHRIHIQGILKSYFVSPQFLVIVGLENQSRCFRTASEMNGH